MPDPEPCKCNCHQDWWDGEPCKDCDTCLINIVQSERAAARAELAELRAHNLDRVDQAWHNGYKTGKCVGYRAAKERDDA